MKGHWGPGARLAYVAVILLATLAGLEPEFDRAQLLSRLSRAFNPEVSGRDLVDGLRNLVLFAGWGVVWLVTGPRTHLPRRVVEATLTGALLSAGVEASQLLSTTRTASIFDLLTNASGSFGGALLVPIAAWALHRKRSARSFLGIPAFIFAGAYLAVVSLEAFIPLFGQETLAGSGGGPVTRLRHALALFEPGSLAELPLTRIPLFAPAGGFLVAALVEAGVRYRSAAWCVAAAAPVFALGIEVLRGASSQPIHLGSALVHAVSIALGAWGAARFLPPLSVRLRGAVRARTFLGAYGLLLAIWSWRPFMLETSVSAFFSQFAAERLLPLAALAMRVDLFSVADVLRQCLLLLPVGGLLAVWPVRKRGPLGGPLPAVYAAVILEVSQLFIADRFFDTTDALVAAAGALIGWVMVRRSGYPVYGELLIARGSPTPNRRG